MIWFWRTSATVHDSAQSNSPPAATDTIAQRMYRLVSGLRSGPSAVIAPQINPTAPTLAVPSASGNLNALDAGGRLSNGPTSTHRQQIDHEINLRLLQYNQDVENLFTAWTRYQDDINAQISTLKLLEKLLADMAGFSPEDNQVQQVAINRHLVTHATTHLLLTIRNFGSDADICNHALQVLPKLIDCARITKLSKTLVVELLLQDNALALFRWVIGVHDNPETNVTKRLEILASISKLLTAILYQNTYMKSAEQRAAYYADAVSIIGYFLEHSHALYSAETSHLRGNSPVSPDDSRVPQQEPFLQFLSSSIIAEESVYNFKFLLKRTTHSKKRATELAQAILSSDHVYYLWYASWVHSFVSKVHFESIKTLNTALRLTNGESITAQGASPVNDSQRQAWLRSLLLTEDHSRAVAKKANFIDVGIATKEFLRDKYINPAAVFTSPTYEDDIQAVTRAEVHFALHANFSLEKLHAAPNFVSIGSKDTAQVAGMHGVNRSQIVTLLLRDLAVTTGVQFNVAPHLATDLQACSGAPRTELNLGYDGPHSIWLRALANSSKGWGNAFSECLPSHESGIVSPTPDGRSSPMNLEERIDGDTWLRRHEKLVNNFHREIKRTQQNGGRYKLIVVEEAAMPGLFSLLHEVLLRDHELASVIDVHVIHMDDIFQAPFVLPESKDDSACFSYHNHPLLKFRESGRLHVGVYLLLARYFRVSATEELESSK